MDLNVIGRWRLEGGKHEPEFRRIVVLSLTSEEAKPLRFNAAGNLFGVQ